MADSTDMFGSDPEDDGDDDLPSAAELEAAGQSALFGDPAPDRWGGDRHGMNLRFRPWPLSPTGCWRASIARRLSPS